MPVDPTHASTAALLAGPVTATTPVATTTAAPAAATATRTQAQTTFRAALERASAGAADRSAAAKATEAPEGETSEVVKGHAYADILTGPRDHLYLNTSENARSGEAFKLIRRGGRDLHVYGSGEDRRIVSVRHRGDDDAA